MRLRAPGWCPRAPRAQLEIVVACALIAPAVALAAVAPSTAVAPLAAGAPAVPVPVTLAVNLSLHGLHPAATSGALDCGAIAQTADWVSAHRNLLTDYASVNRWVLYPAHYFGEEATLRFPIANRGYDGTLTFTTTLSPQAQMDPATRAPYRPGPSVLTACWLMLNGAPAVVDPATTPVVIAPGNVATVNQSPLAVAVGDAAAGGPVNASVPVTTHGLFFAPGPVTTVASVQVGGPAGAQSPPSSGFQSGMATHVTPAIPAAGATTPAACSCTGATGPAGPPGPPGPPGPQGPAGSNKELQDKITALQTQLDALKAIVAVTTAGSVSTVSIKAPVDQADQTLRDYSQTIGRNRTLWVASNDTETIDGNRTEKVAGAWQATVGKTIELISADYVGLQGGDAVWKLGKSNASEKIPGNVEQSIGLNQIVTVGGSQSVSVGKGSANRVSAAYQLTAGTTMDLTAANGITLKGGDVSLQLGKSDQTDQTGGNYTQTIVKNRSVTVGGLETVVIGNASTTQIGAGWQLSAGKSIVVNAAEGITFTTGSSSVTLGKDGTISIKGSSIAVESTGAISLKGGGIVTIQGAKVITN